MKKKWMAMIMAVALCLAIGAAEPALARQGGYGGGYGFGSGNGMGILSNMEDLDLTPDQVKKIQSLRLEMEKETINLRNKFQEKSLEIRELMLADEPDLKKIEAKIDEMVPLRSRMEKAFISYQIRIKSLLTPEQRAKLEMWRGPGKERHFGGCGRECPKS